MITGVVRTGEAHVRLRIRGPRGRMQQVDAVIDTGYTGALTLPPALIARLGLAWQSFRRGILADGTEVLLDVYEARVVWDRRVRPLLVDGADATPLVGMALLDGYELKIEVRPAGLVTINRLP